MRNRILTGIVCLGAVLVIVLAGLALFPTKTDANADSGVTACQDMAARQKLGPSASSTTMTEESYVKALAPFEKSEHSDLKLAGTEFVNSVWNMQKALGTDDEDTPLATTFGILSTMQAKYASLQIACANHGVELKPLT